MQWRCASSLCGSKSTHQGACWLALHSPAPASAQNVSRADATGLIACATTGRRGGRRHRGKPRARAR